MTVDTSEFAAITDRVGALEAGVAELRQRVDRGDEFGSMMARATYGATPARAAPRHAAPKPRHLRVAGDRRTRA